MAPPFVRVCVFDKPDAPMGAPNPHWDAPPTQPAVSDASHNHARSVLTHLAILQPIRTQRGTAARVLLCLEHVRAYVS
jgi:hypothetical protein